MAFAELVKQPPVPPSRKTSCSLCLLLSVLPSAEAKALTNMVDEANAVGKHVWSGRKLHDGIRDEGHIVGRDTIGNHRNGHPDS